MFFVGRDKIFILFRISQQIGGILFPYWEKKGKFLKKRWDYPLYVLLRGLVKLFTPTLEVEGLENLPDAPCIIVANHCQMFGPIAGQLYFPGKRAIWCAGQMMRLKEVPAYAYADFWSRKPKAVRWFYKALSFVPMYIAPSLRKMYLAEPVCVDPQKPVDTQRAEICRYLKRAITDTACKLPRHRVVPYRNVPKREYPYNKEEADEKACC